MGDALLFSRYAPSIIRVRTLIDNILHAAKADDVIIFFPHLRSDTFRQLIINDREIKFGSAPNQRDNDIIRRCVMYEDRSAEAEIFRIFLPIEGIDDRSTGSIVLKFNKEEKISELTTGLIRAQSALIYNEVLSVVEGAKSVFFPHDLKDIGDFNSFLDIIFDQLSNVLLYRTIVLIQILQSKDLEIRKSSFPFLVEIEKNSNFFGYVNEAYYGQRSEIHSNAMSIRRGYPLRNTAGAIIRTSIFFPIETNLFKGVLVLGTALPYFVTLREMKKIEAVVSEFQGVLNTYRFIAEVNRSAKEEARKIAFHEIGLLAQSARHQARSPIDLIKTASRNISSHLFKDDINVKYVYEKIEIIQRASDKAYESLDRMAEQSRVHNFEISRRSFRSILDRAIAIEAARAEALEIKIQTPERDFQFDCYPLFMEHALFHLIQNSIDCFERRGIKRAKKWIKFSVDTAKRQYSRRYVITIEDNAGGFDVEECHYNSQKRIEKIEEIFEIGTSWRHRTHAASDGRGPNGQGLATVRQYIRMHDGTIEPKSASNGAVFVINLGKTRPY